MRPLGRRRPEHIYGLHIRDPEDAFRRPSLSGGWFSLALVSLLSISSVGFEVFWVVGVARSLSLRPRAASRCVASPRYGFLLNVGYMRVVSLGEKVYGLRWLKGGEG